MPKGTLGVNNNNIQKSIEKLSSGYRINRAGDDAAGLAISEKMRAQIRGLKMAQELTGRYFTHSDCRRRTKRNSLNSSKNERASSTGCY